MTPLEKKSVAILATLYAMRMLGLFMILPVFMVLGTSLDDATPARLGLAMGIYGLAQAFLQLPFGVLSDRFGRRPLIYVGLMLFFAGSLLAGYADSVWEVIAGRFLQGAGAIASVLMALLSDLTSEESRTPAMAMVGMSIGLSFTAATVLGPVIAGVAGLKGIFLFTAGLAVLGMLLVRFVLPEPRQSQRHRDVTPVLSDLSVSLRDPQLLRLNVGILVLHLVLTAIFVVVPGVLARQIGIPVASHGWVYLALMVPAFFVMVPFIIIGERRRKVKTVFLGALLVMGAALGLMSQSLGGMIWWAGLFLFFVAFNYLEASLPSLVTKICPAGIRGTAMGVYSTSQFFGAFLGGSLAGWLLQWAGPGTALAVLAVLVLLWFVLAMSMSPPEHTTSLKLGIEPTVAEDLSALSQSLMAIEGVFDVRIVPHEQAAYLKVDRKVLDSEALRTVRGVQRP